MTPDDPVMARLLETGEPSIEVAVRTVLLGEPPDSPAVVAARTRIHESPRVRALLAGQQPDGGFGVHPYQKWAGAHWRLVSLVELRLPPGDPRGIAALDQVLGWLADPGHRRRNVRLIDGRVRRCASQEGYALYVTCRLGRADDPRAALLARSLVEWQWPDGGWNCDKRPEASHSSFHETLPPMRGLYEYGLTTGDDAALAAADRAAELFLGHRLFRSQRTGQVIDPAWLELRHPGYWHYSTLAALRALTRMGRVRDPRASEALDLLAARRLPDGRWPVDSCWWYPPSAPPSAGHRRSGSEVVEWGRRGPNEWITLDTLRVLKAAGRAG